MIFFTADTHFGRSNVIQYEKRPFRTVDEMDEALVENWNRRVSPEDDIYILGDLTLKGPKTANALLERLQGRKYLIRTMFLIRTDAILDTCTCGAALSR